MSKAGRYSLRLNADDLAAAYRDQRDHAPRRARGYFSASRSGVSHDGNASNRTEEHLAVDLFLRGGLTLPNGEQLTLLDYQFPLKSARADLGIGKIDLLGLYDDGTLAVVELKVAGNREDRRIALLEGLIYAAVVEANIEKIAAEVLAVKGRHIVREQPRVLLVAHPDYWSESRTYPATEDLDGLINAVAQAIPLEIAIFGLRNGTLVTLASSPHAVQGRSVALPLDIEHNRKLAPARASVTAYNDDLNRRFWNYGRSSFAAADDALDPGHPEGKSPPVFRHASAHRNILAPPAATAAVVAAIATMTSAEDRHRWFSSMKSSQALAQSVFAGLAVLERLDALENLTAEDGCPAFFKTSKGYRMTLEHSVSTLNEPRPTSLDVFFDGPRKVAVEVKFTEPEFGSCSRPRLRPEDANFARDRCDGSFSVQLGRTTRCSLLEQGIPYWQFVPRIFTWSAEQDHRPCPMALTYQLVRNVLAVCVGEGGKLDTDNNHVLIVYDGRNPAFQLGGNADAAWWAAMHALRYPRLLRRVSWQRIASHLGQFSDLSWLVEGLDDKYGIRAEVASAL